MIINGTLYYRAHFRTFEFHVPDVVVREGGIEHLEVGVVDVLEHQAWRLALRVAHDIQQLDDVRSPAKVLQDLDLPVWVGPVQINRNKIHDEPTHQSQSNESHSHHSQINNTSRSKKINSQANQTNGWIDRWIDQSNHSIPPNQSIKTYQK